MSITWPWEQTATGGPVDQGLHVWMRVWTWKPGRAFHPTAVAFWELKEGSQNSSLLRRSAVCLSADLQRVTAAFLPLPRSALLSNSPSSCVRGASSPLMCVNAEVGVIRAEHLHSGLPYWFCLPFLCLDEEINNTCGSDSTSSFSSSLFLSCHLVCLCEVWTEKIK